MMEVIYKACAGAKPERRAQLVEGIYWLADTIREDIRQKNSTGLLSALANVSALKDIAEELYVDPDQQVDPKRFASACVRAFMSLPN
jgi:hypothetical protein